MSSRSLFACARVAAFGVLVMALPGCSLDEREVSLASMDPGPVGVGGQGEMGEIAGLGGAAGLEEPGAGGMDGMLVASGGATAGPVPSSEQGPEPVGLTPPEGTDVSSQSEMEAVGNCVEDSSEQCGPERAEGVCRFGTRLCVGGEWGACEGAVLPGARDCSADADNDCDGQPDNTLDDVCRCPVGGTRACDEHLGLDGKGPCVAGGQVCVLAADSQTSDWGPCDGAVGPSDGDSCDIPSDDSDCDGTPNGGCGCVDGATLACGPITDEGICQRGRSTCADEEFGDCQGAVFSARRNCTSAVDNDCDGQPDDSLDATCTCEVGSTRACGTHPGRDGNGPCRAGTQTCVAANQNSSSSFGACTGSVGPGQRDSCTVFGDDTDCNGAPNSGCQCVAGRGNQPCAGDPNNSRCNGQGQCAPCQGNADCSLVSGGRNLCIAGVCSAPRCGDGIVQAGIGETCDDGNTVSGDGCSKGCRPGRAPRGATGFAASHMCMVLPSSLGTCWGLNRDGQLGNGQTSTLFNTPVLVGGLSNLVDIVVGPTNSCAVDGTGSVFCWGSFFGSTPTRINGLTDAVQLAAAQNQGTSGASGTNGLPFCVRRSNGRVSCWGADGSSGQLEIGSVARLAMGNAHACAMLTDGGLSCWGSNVTGELGLGVSSNPIDNPTPSTVFDDVAEVIAGNNFTCVRLQAGTVRCVGDGLLGVDGDARPYDIDVPGTVKLASGEQHACAMSNTGQIRCWGASPAGGSTGSSAVAITLPRRAIDVGAGSFASCALLDNGSVHCWGTLWNTGSALPSTSATPVEITGLTSIF